MSEHPKVTVCGSALASWMWWVEWRLVGGGWWEVDDDDDDDDGDDGDESIFDQ